MNIAYLLFYLFIFFKQFYFFESGSFQPGDLFLMLSSLSLLIWYAAYGRKQFSLREAFDKSDLLLLLFTLCTMAVNGFYYIQYHDTRLILSSIYFIYICITVIVFRFLAGNRSFVMNCSRIFRINIYTQLFLYISSMGTYRFEHRWCGSFNDPNQFAFFIMMCLFLSFLINELYAHHSISELTDWIAGIFLIVLSNSSGIAVGITVFLSLYFICISCFAVKNITSKAKSDRYSKRTILFIISALLILMILLAAVLHTDNVTTFFMRIYNKVASIRNGGIRFLLADRGLDKIFITPWGFLYGAGDGAFIRYAATYYPTSEVHCTPIGLWFNYGIIPFIMLCTWIWKNIRKLPPCAYIVYFSLFCECMFLANHRQPFFWMIIVLGTVWRESPDYKFL